MKLISVNVGRARSLSIGPRRVASAIGKRAMAGCVTVRPLGLEGDEQADPSVHGGLAKAVYAYPAEHYAFWRTVRAQASAALWDEALLPGSLGENLTVEGLLENQAWIGDVLRFPIAHSRSASRACPASSSTPRWASNMPAS
jgi:MOSC domain-containing protein YiiM